MARQRYVLQMVEASLEQGATILDLGCGPGEMAAKLMERGFDVWGMDIAEPMIAHARQRCGVDQFRVGDIEEIPFADGSFDAVVCLGVIEYLDGDDAALREIARVLRPGGLAVIATPSAVCPLYHMDRAVGAIQPIYRFLKYRLRGMLPPATEREMRYRKYHRKAWLARLQSTGLQPEEWLCYGWGWYASRLGGVIEHLSNGVERVRHALERLFGRAPVHRVGDGLARSAMFNWIASEQLVRVRSSN